MLKRGERKSGRKIGYFFKVEGELNERFLDWFLINRNIIMKFNNVMNQGSV